MGRHNEANQYFTPQSVLTVKRLADDGEPFAKCAMAGLCLHNLMGYARQEMPHYLQQAGEVASTAPFALFAAGLVTYFAGDHDGAKVLLREASRLGNVKAERFLQGMGG